MALNYAGLGFGFLAKDKNLEQTLTGIASGFSKLQEKFKVVADGAKAAGQKISQGIGAMGKKGKAAFGGMAGMIDSMTSKALSPRIDNAFSSMYAQAAKSWGEIVAGMNLTSKESNRLKNTITSVTYSLNSDFQSAANSVAEFRKHGIKLTEAMGTKGLRGAISRLVKISSTMGLEGQQLALIFSNLTKSYGFNTVGARKMVDVYFAMAKSANIGREAMQALPQVMSTLDANLSEFANAGPKEVQKIIFSLMKVGGAFKAMGADGAKSMTSATEMFTIITKEWHGVAKQFIGKGGAMGELAKGLMEAKGDTSKIFKLLMADPAKFLKGLFQMTEQARKTGGPMSATFLRLQNVIKGAFGPNMAFMMQDTSGRSIKAMKKMDAVSKDSTKTQDALGKSAAKAYKTGLTPGDHYTRMLDSQRAALDKLTNRDVAKWVKNQKSGFKELRERLQKISEKGGPLAEITKRFMLVQRVGMSGFFTGMKGMGPLVQNFVTQSGPMLAALAHMGMSLGMLSKLLMPGGILILGLAMFHKGVRKKVMDAAEKLWDYVSKNYKKWAPKIKAAVIKAWHAAIAGIRWAMDVAAPIMNRMADAISSVNWGGVAQKIIDFVGRFFRGVFDAIFGGSAFEPDLSTPEGRFEAAGMKLIGALGRGMLDMAKTVLQNVWDFFTDWSMGFEEGLRSKGKLLGGALVVGMFFGPTRALLIKGVWAFVGIIAKGLWTLVVAGGPIMWIIAAIGGIAIALYVFRDKVAKFLAPVGNFFKDLGLKIWKYLKWPFNYLFGWLKPMIGGIQALFRGDFVGFFKAIGQTILGYITWPFVRAWMLIKLVFTTIRDYWDEIVYGIKWAAKALIYVLTLPWRLMIKAVVWTYKNIEKIWNGIVAFFKGLWEVVTGVFKWAWDGITSAVSDAWEGMKGIWERAPDFFSGVWEDIKSGAASAWDTVSSWAGKAWDWVSNGGKSTEVSVASSFAGMMTASIKSLQSTMNASAIASAETQKAWDTATTNISNQYLQMQDKHAGAVNGVMLATNKATKYSTGEWNATGSAVGDKMYAMKQAGADSASAIGTSFVKATKIILKSAGVMGTGVAKQLQEAEALFQKAGAITATGRVSVTMDPGKIKEAMTKLRFLYQERLATFFAQKSDISFASGWVQSLPGEAAKIFKEGKGKITLQDAFAKAYRKVIDQIFTAGSKVIAKSMVGETIGTQSMKEINAWIKANYSRYQAMLGTATAMYQAGQFKGIGGAKAWQVASRQMRRRIKKLGLVRGETVAERAGPELVKRGAPKLIKRQKIKVKRPELMKGGKALGETVEMQKRTVIDKQISADTKAAMQDISVQMSSLASAIKALQVYITISGDVGKFLDYTMARGGQQRRRTTSAKGAAFGAKGATGM